nr:ATP-grasp domain-containing protein [Actinomycetota bacterium]
SLSGSRGVIRADDPAGVVAAGRRARATMADAGEDPGGTILVEAFVAGPEVAVEGLLRGSELEVLAIFDKPDPLEGPYFEETIYVTPSRLPASVQEEVAGVVGAGVAAVGLVEGPIHAEVRLGRQGPVLLEVAARSIGGLCSRALRFGAGISLEEVILRHAVGLELQDLHREERAAGVMMVPIPRSGVLEEVRGVDRARAVPGVEGVEVTIPRGHRVRALPEGDRYLGFVFARAGSPQAVEESLRTAFSCLGVVVTDTGAGAGSR